MKKFSKITNQDIKEEPKLDKSLNEKQSAKFKMVNLMDKLLRIRAYGPVDNRFLTGSVKIEGKEMLAEAILDFITELSNNDKIKVLENLKSDIKEWDVIDNKIDNLKSENAPFNSKMKFESLLQRWGSDEGTLLMVAELQSNTMDNDLREDYLNLIDKYDLDTSFKNKLKKAFINK